MLVVKCQGVPGPECLRRFRAAAEALASNEDAWEAAKAEVEKKFPITTPDGQLWSLLWLGREVAAGRGGDFRPNVNREDLVEVVKTTQRFFFVAEASEGLEFAWDDRTLRRYAVVEDHEVEPSAENEQREMGIEPPSWVMFGAGNGEVEVQEEVVEVGIGAASWIKFVRGRETLESSPHVEGRIRVFAEKLSENSLRRGTRFTSGLQVVKAFPGGFDLELASMSDLDLSGGLAVVTDEETPSFQSLADVVSRVKTFAAPTTELGEIAVHAIFPLINFRSFDHAVAQLGLWLRSCGELSEISSRPHLVLDVESEISRPSFISRPSPFGRVRRFALHVQIGNFQHHADFSALAAALLLPRLFTFVRSPSNSRPGDPVLGYLFGVDARREAASVFMVFSVFSSLAPDFVFAALEEFLRRSVAFIEALDVPRFARLPAEKAAGRRQSSKSLDTFAHGDLETREELTLEKFRSMASEVLRIQRSVREVSQPFDV